MTYQVELTPAAAVQFRDLPEPAQDAVVARVAVLVDSPWDARVLPPGNDLAFRETLFDAGHGLLAYYVDETAELVRIFNLIWIS